MNDTCATTSWTENAVRRMAGVLVLISVLLAWQLNIAWLGLATFVGLNLVQSSFTGWCPAEKILRRFDPARS